MPTEIDEARGRGQLDRSRQGHEDDRRQEPAAPRARQRDHHERDHHGVVVDAADEVNEHDRIDDAHRQRKRRIVRPGQVVKSECGNDQRENHDRHARPTR